MSKNYWEATPDPTPPAPVGPADTAGRVPLMSGDKVIGSALVKPDGTADLAVTDAAGPEYRVGEGFSHRAAPQGVDFGTPFPDGLSVACGVRQEGGRRVPYTALTDARGLVVGEVAGKTLTLTAAAADSPAAAALAEWRRQFDVVEAGTWVDVRTARPPVYGRLIDVDTGERIPRVFRFNLTTGEYERYATDERGGAYPDPATGRAATVHGRARLRFEPFPPAEA